MIEFTLNGELVQLDISPDTPLLWALRDNLQKTGTKFGCGKGQCGACTILINGFATRSCLLPIAAVAGQRITTIEGLNGDHPVQQAWIAEAVSQCGYCQPGQIMQAVGLLNQTPQPSVDDIKLGMSGNICRCGTYPRIVKAIQRAAGMTVAPAAVEEAAPVSGVQTFDPAGAQS